MCRRCVKFTRVNTIRFPLYRVLGAAARLDFRKIQGLLLKGVLLYISGNHGIWRLVEGLQNIMETNKDKTMCLGFNNTMGLRVYNENWEAAKVRSLLIQEFDFILKSPVSLLIRGVVQSARTDVNYHFTVNE